MRTWVGVALVTVCLGLAGCSLFGKKQGARNANPKPFTGAEAPAQRETAAVTDPGAPLPGASGLLAGRVVDLATGRPVKATIEVKDLEVKDDVKAARLDVETPRDDGYFTILNLKPGRHYRLIARDREGGGLASKPWFVTPPNSKLYIEVSKDFVTPDTPPVPDPPKVPDKKGATGTGGIQDRTPAATLAPPIRIAPDKDGERNPPPDGGMGASQGGGNGGNISNIAEEFQRSLDSAPANISGPGQSYQTLPRPPPPPQWEGMRDERPAPRTAPPSTPSGPPVSIRVPSQPTRVPSCVLIGNKLENFALKESDGETTWEYRRDRRGRLVLLDFWYSTCTNCLYAIPHLADLQKRYGAFGLEVIGVACETGPLNDQMARVRGAGARYGINYRTLLSGGGPENCPVVRQFGVERYPTLFLLDGSGRIIWRSSDEGMDNYAWQKLEKDIERRLLQSR